MEYTPDRVLQVCDGQRLLIYVEGQSLLHYGVLLRTFLSMHEDTTPDIDGIFTVQVKRSRVYNDVDVHAEMCSQYSQVFCNLQTTFYVVYRDLFSSPLFFLIE